MRFALSAEQQQFAATLDDLLTGADTPAVARAWAAGSPGPGLALWRRLAGVGVTSVAVPEGYDGLGAGAVETVVVFEQLGRHAAPGPLIESLAVVSALLPDEFSERWLPGIASVKIVASVALPPHVPYALDASRIRCC